MMANVIAGRASASAAKADEKKAWDEGMAMPMEEAVRYALGAATDVGLRLYEVEFRLREVGK